MYQRKRSINIREVDANTQFEKRDQIPGTWVSNVFKIQRTRKGRKKRSDLVTGHEPLYQQNY